MAPVPCAEDADPVCLACKSGDGEACLALAMESAGGERHVVITERACELGYAPACAHLGMLLMVPPAQTAHRTDIVEAMCAKGDAATCIIIGHRYAPADAGRALSYFERACAIKPKESCLPLYRMLEGVSDADFPTDASPAVVNHPRAKIILEDACAASDASACFLRGDLDYRFGDEASAAAWDARACEVSPEECAVAAEAYADGSRRAKSPKKSAALFTTACERGLASACESLANAIEGGIGLRRDPRRAAQLHARACELDPRSPGCNAR